MEAIYFLGLVFAAVVCAMRKEWVLTVGLAVFALGSLALAVMDCKSLTKEKKDIVDDIRP